MDILKFCMGALLGSFLNVLIDRLPHGKSILWGRSICDSCQKKLKPQDLVPIISILILRFKCHYCKNKIPSRNMWVEILTGMLFVLLLFHHIALLGIACLLLVMFVVCFEQNISLEITDEILVTRKNLMLLFVIIFMSIFWLAGYNINYCELVLITAIAASFALRFVRSLNSPAS